jgi:hypothetical protein
VQGPSGEGGRAGASNEGTVVIISGTWTGVVSVSTTSATLVKGTEGETERA